MADIEHLVGWRECADGSARIVLHPASVDRARLKGEAPPTIDGAAELACMMTVIGMALRCARASAPQVFNAEVRGFRAWASTMLARGEFTPGQRAALEGALRMVEGELKATWPTAVRPVEDDKR